MVEILVPMVESSGALVCLTDQQLLKNLSLVLCGHMTRSLSACTKSGRGRCVRCLRDFLVNLCSVCAFTVRVLARDHLQDAHSKGIHVNLFCVVLIVELWSHELRSALRTTRADGSASGDGGRKRRGSSASGGGGGCVGGGGAFAEVGHRCVS